MDTRKKHHKPQMVVKPYMKGDAFDKTVLPGALKFFLSTVMMVIAFVMMGIMVNWENKFLSILLNGSILLATYLIFYNSGATSGADAVNQGEIMLQRQEKGRPVATWERSMCFHPLKGFLSALIGSLPLFIAALVLALIAQRQMTTLGVLPSIVDNMQSRPEIGNALAYYYEPGVMTLEAGLRFVIRMAIMPFVNMIGAADKDAMLLLERLSPVLCLLPAISYGVGYLDGVKLRSQVHTNIAEGKRKQKKKQRKELKARQQQAHRGPEQLN